jgi:hypothetical protein
MKMRFQSWLMREERHFILDLIQQLILCMWDILWLFA